MVFHLVNGVRANCVEMICEMDFVRYKIPACCDDDDDHNSAITPNEPVDSLSIGDEHLNTILATESNEFIKSCVKNLVLNPSKSEGENGCDAPACFTTFSNILFDAEYEFNSSDDQSLSHKDFPEEIFSNPLFEEEIIPMMIDQHHFNVESDLIESMLNHDSSIISSSLKIDSLLDELAGELTLLKSILLGIDKIDCDPEGEIRLTKRLLYDNSSPRPPKEFVSRNSDANIESFSPSPIPVEDSDSRIEEIDLSFNLDDPMPPSIEDDDDDSERDIQIHEELLDSYSLSLPVNESFHFDIPPAFSSFYKTTRCKAYIILNKHTRKVKESLNVTFDETPPPSKTSPLVDDDLDEEEATKVNEKKNLENDIEDETLEIDEIVNIKESRNHPLENVIGNLNQRTLRSQAQNESNFFCFISTIEPKNVNEALKDDS
nr:retrovirus-related Pol polyprotein from transposon TNT 1-94 [Tanacetum cinerariifolium]